MPRRKDEDLAERHRVFQERLWGEPEPDEVPNDDVGAMLDDALGEVPDEAEQEQVPSPSGPYRAGSYFVLRGSVKLAACYAAEGLSADEVAAMITAALNKEAAR